MRQRNLQMARPLRFVAQVGAVLALLELLTACDGRARDGGTEHQPYSLDTVPTWGVVEVVRIGSQDLPAGFSRVAAIAVAEDQRLYVVDPVEHVVRVWGPDGQLLRSIGRRGDGPGELRGPSAMGIIGDTLWVRNGDGRRITLFSLEGSLLATVSLVEPVVVSEPGEPLVRALLGPPRPDGTFEPVYTFSTQRVSTGLTYSDSVHVRRIVFNADGQPINTGRTEKVFPSGVAYTAQVDVGTFSIPVSTRLFPDHPLQFGEHDAPRVLYRPARAGPHEGLLLLAELDTVGAIHTLHRYRFSPIRLDARKTDSIMTWYSELIQGSTGRGLGFTPPAAEIAAALRSTVTLPDYIPAVTLAQVGRDGSMWLRREGDGSEIARWTVLAATGQPVGEVALPRGATLHVIEQGYVWASVADDFGVPYVVKYRIQH